MNAILVSVPPEICARIANGEQTLLPMKRLPKLETPYKVYMYCTGGAGKELVKDILYRWNGTRLIKRRVDKGWLKDNPEQTWQILLDYGFTHPIHNGTYVLNGKIISSFTCRGIMHPNDSLKLMAEQSCMSEAELDEYAKGKTPYGLRITDLTIFDEPKELGEFRKPCKVSKRIPCSGCGYASTYMERCERPALTRPPQSWCYCEEVSE